MEWLSQQTEQALQALRGQITVIRHSTPGHEIIMLNGLETPATLQTLATCLLGVACQIIQEDFRLSVELLDNSQEEIEYLRNEISNLINSTHVDAWITEAVFFILVIVAEELHPPGRMLVQTLPHTSATRQGLDMTGLFWDNTASVLGTAIGEVKAYDDLNNGISRSVASFQKIEDNSLGAELRSVLYKLKPRLPQQYSQFMVGAIWRRCRSYIPAIFFGHSPSYQLTLERSSFASYDLPNTHKLLVLSELMNRQWFYTQIKRDMIVEIVRWTHNV